MFRPAIELTGGYDTNPARTSAGVALVVFDRRAGAAVQFELGAP